MLAGQILAANCMMKIREYFRKKSCFSVRAEFMHVKPGKGAAFVRSKLKNYVTGNTNERTFRAGESVATADIERLDTQFTYAEGDDVRPLHVISPPPTPHTHSHTHARTHACTHAHTYNARHVQKHEVKGVTVQDDFRF